MAKSELIQSDQKWIPPSPAEMVSMFLGRLRTENSRKTYAVALKSYFGDYTPNDLHIFKSKLTPEKIQKWVALLKETRGPSTTAQYFSIVSQFLRHCHEAGLLERNPMTPYIIASPKKPVWEPQIGLEHHHLKKMIIACNNDKNRARGLRDKAILHIGFSCCLRVSEIHRCNYYDFVLSGSKTELKISKTKSGVKQTVDVGLKTRKAIENFLLEIGGKEALVNEKNDSKIQLPVFVSLSNKTYGQRLSISSISKMIKTRSKQAELNMDVHSHMLRHAGITHLIAIGWNLEDIKDHARHGSIDQTLQYRNAWLKRQKASAGDALDGILSPQHNQRGSNGSKYKTSP